MSKIIVIQSRNEIDAFIDRENLFAFRWEDPKKFNCRYRIVDVLGKKTEPNYEGTKFYVVAKKIRVFGLFERFLNLCYVSVMIAISLGEALKNKKIMKWIDKQYESARFLQCIQGKVNS